MFEGYRIHKNPHLWGGAEKLAVEYRRAGDIGDTTAVRLKVEENQLVDVFGEIGFHIDGLKGA